MSAVVYSVASVQVAQARKVQISGRSILTAIHKTAVHGPVVVKALGLHGDEQADLSVHGGLEKAVYAYPAEHYAFWNAARSAAGVAGIDTDLTHGSIGENLTLNGLLETDVWVGDVLRFANCALRVEQPREPCYKFNAVMGFPQAGRAMAIAGCCGYYLAVEQTGTIAAGQQATLEPGQRGLSIAQAFAGKFAKHAR